MLTSVAAQSVDDLGGRLSVLARQKSDHVILDGLLSELGSSSGADQDRVLLRICRLVFPHAFAEESVLWPVLRRVLPDGHRLTLGVEQEHQEVNELVRRLDAIPPASAERGPILERLTTVLREDVRDEEDELFPRLQEVVSPEQLRLLGLWWEIVRRVAPTRAHPVVARRPPGNVLAALPLTVLDRLRDRADAAAHRNDAASGDVLRGISAVLGTASHAVERLPIHRTGGDPSTRKPARPSRSRLLTVPVAVGLLALLVHRIRRRG